MTDRRAIRVFVSSTFRDMQAERDELVKRVFPELRRRCEARGVGWSEVDLRWGVTDEEKAEGAVLPICLAEIEHSRPYFIGLIGDRYGWVPDEIDADLQVQQGWLAEMAGRSVTELEILHGVLNDPAMAGHAYFYLRDPAWAAALPHAEAATYIEGAGTDEIAVLGAAQAEAGAAHRRAQLATLKDRIRASGFPVRDGYPEPRAIGDCVLEDLGRLIDDLFPADVPVDPLAAERAAHDAYAEARFGLHVGGAADRAAIDAHIASGAGPLLITGPPGTGKSALLATWAAAQTADLVVTHHIGASASAADPTMLVARVAAEIARAAEVPFDPSTLPTNADARRVAFAELLRQAGAVRRIVLVIDGLDQLEDRDQAPDLAWLPYELPPGIILLASATGGRPVEATRARGWPEYQVAPLGPEDRRELIDAYLARFAKRLGPDLVDRLATHASAANPLFLRIILDELRQHGDHFTLGEMIDRHLAAPDLRSLYGIVLARWEQDFDRDRPDLVREALTLLWAARRGLSEPELADLLGANHGTEQATPLPHALWSPVHLAADESLMDRSGLLGYMHEPLRHAVAARWLTAPDAANAVHRQIAGYFATREVNPRVVAELPWQLQAAGAWPELAAALARPELLTAAYVTDLPFVRTAWAAVEGHGGPSMPDAYASVIEDPSSDPDLTWAVARLLTDAGHTDAALVLHRRLVDCYRSDGNRVRLGASLANLAAAHLVRDERTDAEAALVEQEAIARELGDDRLLQVALGNQGTLHRARGEYDAALARMADEEALCRTLGDLAGLQSSVSNQGAVLRDRRDLDGALARFVEQERIARQLGDPALISRALGNQALVLGDRGDTEGALTLLTRLEDTCRTFGDRAGLAAALGNRAGTLLQVGRLDEAEQAALEQGEIALLLGTDTLLAQSTFIRATIAHNRGDRTGAYALLDEHRVIVERTGDRAALALALGERATLTREGGDHAGAHALHAEEAALYEALGDRSGTATSLSNQALIAYEQGRPLDAVALVASAEIIVRDLQIPAMLQSTLGNKAAFLLQAGDLASATTALAEQETICRSTGNRTGLAACVGNLGLLRLQQGDLVDADRYLAEQEQLCREIGDGAGIDHALGNRISVAVQRNDPRAALGLLDAQLLEARQRGPVGSPAVVANLVRQMQVRPALGDLAGLQALLVGLEAEARGAQDQAVLAECLAIRGTIAMGGGDVASATALLTEAEAPARASGNGHALQLLLGNRGLLALQQGQLDTAEPMLREQEQLCRTLGIPDGLSAALGNLAILFQHRGDGTSALRCLTEQEHLCRQNGDSQGLVLALANRGEVTARLGNKAEGLAALDEAAAIARQIGWAEMVPQIEQLTAQLRDLPG